MWAGNGVTSTLAWPGPMSGECGGRYNNPPTVYRNTSRSNIRATYTLFVRCLR
jgi:hypothetical protein